MKRFLSMILVVSIVVSFFVIPSTAVGFNETPVIAVRDMESVSVWEEYWESKFLLISDFTSAPISLLQSCMDSAIAKVVPGSKSSLPRLISSVSGFDKYWSDSIKSIASNPLTPLPVASFSVDIDIGIDPVTGFYRPYDKISGIPIVNCLGEYPYYKPTNTDETTGTTTPDPDLGGKWILESKVNWKKVNVLSEYNLYSMGGQLKSAVPDNDIGTYEKKYYYLGGKWDDDSSGDHYVYCDSSGRPYVARIEENQWSQNNTNNYYTDVTEQGDTIYNTGDTIENQLIDNSTNTVWFPDGTLNYIDELIYDTSTKTYYVDAHEEYDLTNNTYVTNNYKYEYHINYTSVTYIGQTEEYDERYEFYYELPDGRSSADLTAEELQVLNTQIDVLPYIRSADDTSIRALYHFDGDCLDSSYWSHLGSLTWNKGASITYMDAGAFNGALYLDENEHQFTIKLPSNLGTGDLTFQFRYYQSATLSPADDTHINIGGWDAIHIDGERIGSNGLTSAYTVPLSIGNWQEYCIVRKDGVWSRYHNGVLVSSVYSLKSLSDSIVFTFGSGQQTYKYIDEVRIVNKALYDETGYTPSSVPFDTNLALVLPDSQLPVADEYWDITSSGENLLSASGIDWCSGYVTGSHLTSISQQPTLSHADYWDINKFASSANAVWPMWGYNSVPTGVTIDSGGLSLTSHLIEATASGVTCQYPLFNCNTTNWPTYGLCTLIASYDSDGTVYKLPYGSYIFSILTEDGTITSLSFTNGKPGSYYDDIYVEGGGYRVSVQYGGWSSSRYAWLTIQPLEYDNPAPRIVYMELIEGTETDLSAEFVSSVVVMDKDDLHTPSLAVRTDINISGYQLGGVRPSLPEKGLVWALVESGRITSLQIYNGQAWEGVDGRIWTGSRWIPYYAYDVLLLKDMWDIVESDPTIDPIYTESGFWSWLQNAWGNMLGKLDQIIDGLAGITGIAPPASDDCPHVYESEVAREPTCTEPGHLTYTCTLCGHAYTELIDATGHDWITTNTVPDVLDEEGNVIEKGYEELTCSKCDTVSRDYGEGPEEVDIFEALGDFIADGITWILDKLEELADSLRSITDSFNSFIEKISGLAGGFPLFFAGFMALIPEELMNIFWFSVIGFVVLAVWKKWSS